MNQIKGELKNVKMFYMQSGMEPWNTIILFLSR